MKEIWTERFVADILGLKIDKLKGIIFPYGNDEAYLGPR